VVPGRISLPVNAQQLWSQHKYSVLARDHGLYKRIGQKVAKMRRNEDFTDLALLLVMTLRQAPAEGGLRNTLQHMWGHVSGGDVQKIRDPLALRPARLLKIIQERAREQHEPFLMASTALGELMAWVD